MEDCPGWFASTIGMMARAGPSGPKLPMLSRCCPDRIAAVIGVELLHVARLESEGGVQRRAGVVALLAVVERAPPVLDRFDEIGVPLKRRHAGRAVEVQLRQLHS